MTLPISFTAKAHSLRLPAHLHERVHPYVRTHQKGEQRQTKSAETAPFARQIDFWALSVAYAVSKGLAPDASMATAKFVDTRAVDFPAWLGDLLCILAVDAFGHENDRVQDPGDIIDLANQYAAAGTEPLLGILDKSFPGLPLHVLLDKLSEQVVETCGSPTGDT